MGIFITHLVRWLANPADEFARGVLAMSPLAPSLVDTSTGKWWELWNQLTGLVSRDGLAHTVESIIQPYLTTWSAFGQRRAGDLMSALRGIEQQGITSITEAAAWLERLEVSQSPGTAAVQVMTIHKSKGLGFDVVVLPHIPEDEVPLAQRFDVAEGEGWMTETPPKWARSLIPEMRDAEARWADAQRYEAFCTLYVALTRAKRGLYVLLEPPKPKADPAKPSLANWIRQTCDSSSPSIIHQCGKSDWGSALPDFAAPATPPAPTTPGPAVPRPLRYSATSSKGKKYNARPMRAEALEFGKQVHELLESISWLDDAPIVLPDDASGRLVSKLLQSPTLQTIFRRNGRHITLMREQPIDGYDAKGHFSGIIDRLHLHLDAGHRVVAIDLIDFKTDAVSEEAELRDRYQSQINAYRQALAIIHPAVPIRGLLVSTHLESTIEVEESVAE